MLDVCFPQNRHIIIYEKTVPKQRIRFFVCRFCLLGVGGWIRYRGSSLRFVSGVRGNDIRKKARGGGRKRIGSAD